MNLASIENYAGRLIIVAGLALVSCGGGKAGTDAGGGNAAGGAGGRGGTSAGGRGGFFGEAGSTGAAGTGAVAGTTGAAGATGGSAGTSGVAGSSGTTGSAGRGGGGGGVAGGAGGRGGTGGRGGAGGTTGTGGMGGGSCSPSCGLTDFCNWSGNNCDGVGTCQFRPMDCTPPENIVCGCDGRLYINECEANGSGRVDTQPMSGCPTPSGTFRCGIVFCMHGTQYCETRSGGAASNFTTYACRDLPAGCGATPTCACIQGTAQCGNCTMSASGDLMTACLFP